MSWNTRRIPDDYKQDWEWKAISRSRAFQRKNNEWELRTEADSERPASIQNAWPPAELIIARALAKVLTKPIILMQGIEATSPMLESFRVAHGIKDRMRFVYQHYSMRTTQYPDTAKILK